MSMIFGSFKTVSKTLGSRTTNVQGRNETLLTITVLEASDDTEESSNGLRQYPVSRSHIKNQQTPGVKMQMHKLIIE